MANIARAVVRVRRGDLGDMVVRVEGGDDGFGDWDWDWDLG